MKHSTHVSIAIGLFISAAMCLAISPLLALTNFTLFALWMTFNNPGMRA